MIKKLTSDIGWYFMPNSPTRVMLCYEAGAIYQSKSHPGMAHLVEHLILSDAGVKSIVSWPDRISGYTDKNFITINLVFYDDISFVTSIVPNLISAISECQFSVEDISKELSITKNELSDIHSDYPNTSQMILHDYLSVGKVPGGDSYLGLVEGDLSTMGDITPDTVRSYVTEHLSAPQKIAVISGLEITDDIKRDFETKIAQNNPKNNQSIVAELLPASTSVNSKTTLIKDNLYALNDRDYCYLGIGWSSDFISAIDYVDQYIFFSALSNPENSFYKALRSSDLSVYDFLLDTDVIAQKLNIFSIHTRLLRKNRGKFLDKLNLYLEDKNTIRKDVSNQLDFIKASINEIYDGSDNLLGFITFGNKIGMNASRYIELVDSLTVEDILESSRKFNLQNSAVLES